MSYAERFTQTHKTNFTDAARLAVDYQQSRLRATVSEMACEGERSQMFTYYDSVVAQDREGRVPTLRDNPANRRRRWLKYRPIFDSVEFIDSNDKFQGMTNFQSPLMQVHSGAVRRKIDERIIEGVFGDGYEGEVGGATIAFPSANVIGVAVQAGAGTAAVGMNLEKIKRSRLRLALAKFDLDMEEPYLLVTAEQIDDLSNEIELKSKDYVEEAGPQFSRTGKLSKVWNHWIIEFQGLPEKTVTSGTARIVQRNPVYMKSCVMLGVWMDAQFNAFPIPERDNELAMVAKANMDCRRADEKGVGEIESDLRAA